MVQYLSSTPLKDFPRIKVIKEYMKPICWFCFIPLEGE